MSALDLSVGILKQLYWDEDNEESLEEREEKVRSPKRSAKSETRSPVSRGLYLNKLADTVIATT